MKSALETYTEVSWEYEKDPFEWRLLAGVDAKSPSTKTYFFHYQNCWVIMCPLFGLNGVGQKCKTEEEDGLQELLDNPVSFGLRPLSERMIELIIKGYDKKVQQMLEKVEPVSGGEITDTRPAGVSTGPVVMCDHPLAEVVPSQAKLEQKLRKSLYDLTDGMYR